MKFASFPRSFDKIRFCSRSFEEIRVFSMIFWQNSRLSAKFGFFQWSYNKTHIFCDFWTEFTFFPQSFGKILNFSTIFWQNSLFFLNPLTKFAFILRFFVGIRVFPANLRGKLGSFPQSFHKTHDFSAILQRNFCFFCHPLTKLSFFPQSFVEIYVFMRSFHGTSIFTQSFHGICVLCIF